MNLLFCVCFFVQSVIILQTSLASNVFDKFKNTWEEHPVKIKHHKADIALPDDLNIVIETENILYDKYGLNEIERKLKPITIKDRHFVYFKLIFVNARGHAEHFKYTLSSIRKKPRQGRFNFRFEKLVMKVMCIKKHKPKQLFGQCIFTNTYRQRKDHLNIKYKPKANPSEKEKRDAKIGIRGTLIYLFNRKVGLQVINVMNKVNNEQPVTIAGYLDSLKPDELYDFKREQNETAVNPININGTVDSKQKRIIMYDKM